ncbi:MAG: FAD-binding oxidoreductase, partial [Chloroflexi bacterium]|nr:FAD-binding oxidoreductase [Chloroflexota bacterium]
MSQAFDVIIIGAGIMGCATAFELAKRGVNVAVLERDHLGAGSTGKSSAIIRQHYSNEVTARMALHGLRVFQNFEAEVGGESGFTEAGILLLATEKDLEGLAVNVAMMQKIRINTEIIYPDEMRKRWPYLDTEGLAGAAYEPEAGQADPNMTLNSYAAAARRYGAEIFL